jgi:hypothetical protein
MEVTITQADLEFARDEGTVVVFAGTDQDGGHVTFGADHRAAQDVISGIRDSDDGQVVAEVEPWQVTHRVPLRKGRIARSKIGGPTGETAQNYLPANYRVTEVTPEYVYFAGHDNAGWTLEDYVIPRLASGLIWAEEVKEDK